MTAITPPAVPANCVHHWLCEEPNGPYSHAKCKKCGAERELCNTPVVDNRYIPLGTDPERDPYVPYGPRRREV